MAKIKATHRLRRPHQVMFDPLCHFLKGDKPKRGDRVKLPAGTHVIPSEEQLANLPDRFESLSTPEPPAEVEVDDDDEPEGEGDGNSTSAEVTPSGTGQQVLEEEEVEKEDEVDTDVATAEAHAAVDAALEAVEGEWDALTSAQLQELAKAYELEVQGTGSGGNVLKADWIGAVQGARGAAA